MNSSNSTHFLKLLRARKKEMKEKYGVKNVGIFGSYVRSEEKETSDIDILVEFEEPSFDHFMDLAFFLEDLFGKRVDLVTTKGLSPYINPFVEKEVVWVE